MAKVTDQIIPSYFDFNVELDEPAPFPPVYRSTLAEASPKKGLPESIGVARKTLHGKRPATRTKRRKGYWTCRQIQQEPINYATIADSVLWIYRMTDCGSRLIFKRATMMWAALPPAQKQCWLAKNKESGKKCSYYDFFVRAQIKRFRKKGSWDTETCVVCPSPEILFTTATMQPGKDQTLSLADPQWGPYVWQIQSGLGTLTPLPNNQMIYTSPGSNPFCTSSATIRVTDRCGRAAFLFLATNTVQTLKLAYTITNSHCWHYVPQGTIYGNETCGSKFCYGCFTAYYACDGSLLHEGRTGFLDSNWDRDISPYACDTCKAALSKVLDQRPPGLINQGCCPAALR